MGWSSVRSCIPAILMADHWGWSILMNSQEHSGSILDRLTILRDGRGPGRGLLIMEWRGRGFITERYILADPLQRLPRLEPSRGNLVHFCRDNDLEQTGNGSSKAAEASGQKGISYCVEAEGLRDSDCNLLVVTAFYHVSAQDIWIWWLYSPRCISSPIWIRLADTKGSKFGLLVEQWFAKPHSNFDIQSDLYPHKSQIWQ